VNINWLLGWATPESWFAPLARSVFPDARHQFLPATAAGLGNVLRADPSDQVVGYSLGTLLLLGAATQLGPNRKVALLAPIFAFPREEDLGGRIARTQVRQLARWLRHDRASALADFYSRAGINIPADSTLPFTIEELLWGLEQLEANRCPPHLPAGWRGWCGDADVLLDAARLHELDPGISIVPGATHHPERLLAALAQQLN